MSCVCFCIIIYKLDKPSYDRRLTGKICVITKQFVFVHAYKINSAIKLSYFFLAFQQFSVLVTTSESVLPSNAASTALAYLTSDLMISASTPSM